MADTNATNESHDAKVARLRAELEQAEREALEAKVGFRVGEAVVLPVTVAEIRHGGSILMLQPQNPAAKPILVEPSALSKVPEPEIKANPAFDLKQELRNLMEACYDDGATHGYLAGILKRLWSPKTRQLRRHIINNILPGEAEPDDGYCAASLVPWGVVFYHDPNACQEGK